LSKGYSNIFQTEFQHLYAILDERLLDNRWELCNQLATSALVTKQGPSTWPGVSEPGLWGPLTEKTAVQLQPRSAKVSQGRPRSAKVSQGQPRSAKVSQGQPRSAKVSQGQPRSAKVSQGQPRSAKVSQGQPRSAKVGQGQPRSACARVSATFMWTSDLAKWRSQGKCIGGFLSDPAV
jgi:hypothetical protein